MQEQWNCFKEIQDPRSIRNQKHPVLTLIGTSLLASLAGIDSFSGFADFAESHLEILSQYFEFPNGSASHDTYQRFWDALDPEAFYRCFQAFTKTLADVMSTVIHIDGKVIRNSGTDKALHFVSAWCQANQLVLAQEKVSGKSNEITALPKLIDLLDVRSKIITIDAMGAQREVCDQIVQKGGDYLISLKGNQGTLHQDVMHYFQDERLREKCASSEENDKGHGRVEQRTAYVCHQIDWLQKEHRWPSLRSIGMVVSTVHRGEKTIQEQRFYISSLPADARQLNEVARSHWGIENKLHWRLDVVFNEDKSCIRNDNAAENVDILRKWALNVLNKATRKPGQSIKSLMRKNAMSFKHLLKIVNEVFHA